jgi:uncharacterized membrane protein YdjX (TVP38/TMEM64 family)
MMSAKPERNDRAARLPARRLGLPLAVVLLLAAAWQSGLLENVSLSGIVRHHEVLAEMVAANRVAALAAYVGLYVLLVSISFPGASLLTLAGGYLFGGMAGAIASIAAATGGAVVIFLIARSSFGGLLEKKAGSFSARMAEGFRQDAFSYLLSLRLAPVFPFWVINIVPAILNMRLAPYALATLLGIVPATFAISFIGSGLGSIIAAQELAHPGCAAAGNCSIDLHSLMTPQLLAALACLALLALAPAAARRIGPGRRGVQPPAS